MSDLNDDSASDVLITSDSDSDSDSSLSNIDIETPVRGGSRRRRIVRSAGTELPVTMTVTDVKSTELKIEETKEFKELVTLIRQEFKEDPMNMLPKVNRHKLEFKLNNCYSAFANGIRRTLIGELVTKCLDFDEKQLTTNDNFILTDVNILNINLIPINQDLDETKFANQNIYLYKYNDTNEIMEIKASDIRIASKSSMPKSRVAKTSTPTIAKTSNRTSTKTVRKSTRGRGELSTATTQHVNIDTTEVMHSGATDFKHPRESIKVADLIPNADICIGLLRAGKYIKINNMQIVSGKSRDDAGKFTLLDNITYNILDMEPFDMFQGKGTRSIEYDPKQFYISFTTSGNVKVQTVVRLLYEQLKEKLTKAKNKLNEFMQFIAKDPTKKYYNENGLEVTIDRDGMMTYNIHGEYVTLTNMLAQKCYAINSNVSFCTPGVDRYDKNSSYIKLATSQPNELLMTAIDTCSREVEVLYKSLRR